jgi:hypothetical protein
MSEDIRPSVKESFFSTAVHDLSGIHQLLELVRSHVGWELQVEISPEHAAAIAPFECNRTLLRNAVDTMEAALLLMKSGYRLQPGMLIRPMVESLAYVVHIFKHPEDLGKFKADRLDTRVALETGASIAPQLKRYWGFLSENYAHISDLYREHRPCDPYDAHDQVLALNLRFARETTFLIAVVSEYVMYAPLKHRGFTPWFWREVPGGVQFQSSAEGQAWRKEYMPDRV